MKAGYLIVLLVPFLMANETKRIEDIVSDITALRHAYETCENKLKTQNDRYDDLNKKLTVRNVEVEADQGSDLRTIELLKEEQNTLIKKNRSLIREAAQVNKRIKTLEQLVKDQRAHIASISTDSEVTQKPCLAADSNPFPKLLSKTNPASVIMVKKEISSLQDDTHVESKKIETKAVPKRKTTVTKSVSAPKSEFFKPSTYRLNQESAIYNAPQGENLGEWDAKTSFTSNEKWGEWTRITGYFIEGKWKSAGSKKLWIKTKFVTKRK